MIKDKILLQTGNITALLFILLCTKVDTLRLCKGMYNLFFKIIKIFNLSTFRYRNGQLIYPKPIRTIPVYEGRQEVEKFEDLDELISDPDEMRMQVCTLLLWLSFHINIL